METGRATAGCLFAKKCNVAVSMEGMKLMDIAKNWRFQRGRPADEIREESWETVKNKCNVAIPHGRKTNGRPGEQNLEKLAFFEA